MVGDTETRRLPLALAIMKGESLPSYLDRLADHFDVPLGLLYRSVGLAPSLSGPIRRITGLALPDSMGASLICATSLDHASLRDALLASYAGTAFRQAPGRGSGDAIDGWVHLVGSSCCPSCLASSADGTHGVWKLSWKLPWLFVCTRHSRLLVSSCPSCGIRLGGAAKDGSTAFALTTVRLKPGCCIGPRDAGGASRAERICAHDLSTISSPIVSSGSRVFQAQKTLEHVLAGRPPHVAGVESTPLLLLNDLRAICSLLLRCAEPEDLGSLPVSASGAFQTHVEHRAGLCAHPSSSARRGRRLRAYQHPPRDPTLMAAIVPIALEALTAPSQSDLVERLGPFVDRAQRANKHTMRNVLDGYELSQPLAAAFDRCRQLRGPLPTRLRRAGSAAAAQIISLDEVPQLFWSDLYETHLASLFSRGWNAQARRFCSIAFANALGAVTVAEAVRALDLPRSAIATAYEWRRRLAVEQKVDLFQERIEALLPIVAARTRPNLAQRRRKLQAFAEVPTAEWSRICAEAGLGPGRPINRRYAAAWLWAEITGGDYRLSPAVISLVNEGRPPAVVNDRVRRFVRSPRGERLAPGLRRLGEALI